LTLLLLGAIILNKGDKKMLKNGGRKDESFESMLRRFKKQIEQDGILREIRDRKHYEKPSERKRKKRKARGRKK